MDGFQIAKNVQQLSDEREKLSVDLADKTKQIRMLLEEHQRLKQQLARLGIADADDVGTSTKLYDRTPKIREPKIDP